MAHIVEFSVEGLVGRTDTYSQHLNRDVNVFFGPNGNGKTSLLKILHSAMSGDSSILTNVSFKAAEVKVFSEEYGKIFTHTFKKAPVRRPEATEYVLSPSLTQQPLLFEDPSEPWHRYVVASEISNWTRKPKGPKSRFFGITSIYRLPAYGSHPVGIHPVTL